MVHDPILLHPNGMGYSRRRDKPSSCGPKCPMGVGRYRRGLAGSPRGKGKALATPPVATPRPQEQAHDYDDSDETSLAVVICRMKLKLPRFRGQFQGLVGSSSVCMSCS